MTGINNPAYTANWEALPVFVPRYTPAYLVENDVIASCQLPNCKLLEMKFENWDRPKDACLMHPMFNVINPQHFDFCGKSINL
jgi:hypothetical protein